MLFEEKHSLSNHYCYLEYEDMNCLLHCQTSFEVVFVRCGSIALELKGKELTLHAGECAWILPYEIHRILTPDRSQVSIAIFSTDYLPDFDEALRGRSLHQPVFAFSQTLLDGLTGEPTNRFALKSALYSLASSAIAGGISKKDNQAETDHSVRIMIYLQDHYRETVTLQTLADELGYSYSYTSAIFQSGFHKSFSQILNDYRLEEAASLLRSSHDSITHISQQCGFSTIRNFNLLFKKRFGLSPREYQQQT